jgi:SAM-dependent methyltransferase
MREDQYEIHAAIDRDHWWWRGRRAIALAALDRFWRPGPTARIAEVGCGTGGNLLDLARLGRVLGAELDPGAVELARSRVAGAGVEVVQHAIPDPLPGRFDLLVLFDVLEHLDDDAGALRWAEGQLEPGGLVLLTVPALDCLWSEQDDVVGHRRRYTLRELEAVVPPELEVLHATYFNSLLFAPILLARTAMRLTRLLRSGPPQSHLGIPPAPVNHLLERVFRLERHLAPRLHLPVGVSLLLLARSRRPPSGTPPA